MRPNDYIEEPYVYTREEELILKIKSCKGNITRLEIVLSNYKLELTNPTYSDYFISGEVKKLKKN